jgi:hypothetical protein
VIVLYRFHMSMDRVLIGVSGLCSRSNLISSNYFCLLLGDETVCFFATSYAPDAYIG